MRFKAVTGFIGKTVGSNALHKSVRSAEAATGVFGQIDDDGRLDHKKGIAFYLYTVIIAIAATPIAGAWIKIRKGTAADQQLIKCTSRSGLGSKSAGTPP